MKDSDRIGDERSASRMTSPKRKVLNPDHDRMGVAGEHALADFFGVARQARSDRIYGDRGVDLKVALDFGAGQRIYTIDVKTSSAAYSLLVEPGKKYYAEIFVLAQWMGRNLNAMCVGWEFREAALAAPLKKIRLVNHSIPIGKLRQMSDLKFAHDLAKMRRQP